MSFFSGFRAGMKNFGQNISIIINTILLFLVYLLGVGFTSIIARLTKKDFLNTSLSKPSYWVVLDKKTGKKEDYYRQF